ncbi:MAG: aspartyl protease family protein [Dinoroseobacter sp.]|jgi:aspartyl protease family protein
MSSDQYMQVGYLVVFGIVLSSYLYVKGSGRVREMLRHAASWVLIFVCALIGAGLWVDSRDTGRPQHSVFAEEGRIEVPRGRDGHYHLTLQINGVSVPMVVDTGASDLVLSRADAERIGLNDADLVFAGRANTANGPVTTAHVRLDQVRLGGIEDQFVPAIVNGGEMQKSLLGMSYLSRFSRIEIAENRLILVR